jgi:hypothetical protein
MYVAVAREKQTAYGHNNRPGAGNRRERGVDGYETGALRTQEHTLGGKCRLARIATDWDAVNCQLRHVLKVDYRHF